MSKKIWIGLITFVAIVISILLQINFLNSFPLFGIKANLALVIVCGIALMSGKVSGVLTGISYGIFLDIIARQIIWIIHYFICGSRDICK